MINFTPIARHLFRRNARRIEDWAEYTPDIQTRQLRWLLFKGASTEFGQRFGFEDLVGKIDPRKAFADRVPLFDYEDIREDVMRVVDGEKDILWPGVCKNFAQSSGTSGGRSKYIPVTRDSLRVNHYAGSADVMSQYLKAFPESRIFSGKGLILGGSFDSQLHPSNPEVKVGDLSATLIELINPVVNLFRVPSKSIALMKDWSEKLDLLASEAAKQNITNLSGVPSWMYRVLLRALEISGKNSLSELWPNLEVFFHGGISFEPYRNEYAAISDTDKFHFFETYNASEGFFATQCGRVNDGLLLLIDRGIYYEFIPVGESDDRVVSIEDLQPGKIYELIITSCNGLWRYRIGDTVEVVSVNPVKIRIAGRTRSFINAFGEELMESNAERAIAAACRESGASVANYTAGPLYAHGKKRGRHQWLIEWITPPADINRFGEILDRELQLVNSDYAAKRAGNIFLDAPEIITLPAGKFDSWLQRMGNRKLGGQRKIPRLRNDRSLLDSLLP